MTFSEDKFICSCILSFLDLRGLSIAQRVCKLWNESIGDNEVNIVVFLLT